MRTALKAGQKLKDNEPQDHDDDSNHGGYAEPFRATTNTENSSVEKEGAQFDTSQDGSRRHVQSNLKLSRSQC